MKVILIFDVDTIEQAIEVVTKSKKCWLSQVTITEKAQK